jgi:hypothetical protein
MWVSCRVRPRRLSRVFACYTCPGGLSPSISVEAESQATSTEPPFFILLSQPQFHHLLQVKVYRSWFQMCSGIFLAVSPSYLKWVGVLSPTLVTLLVLPLPVLGLTPLLPQSPMCLGYRWAPPCHHGSVVGS